jgi:hypothetical protein
VKYGEMTSGQNKSGGFEALQVILRSAKEVEVKEIFQKLFDENGRRIPPIGLSSEVCDPKKKFKLIQPEINYAERLERLIKFFPQGTKFVSADEFQSRCEALLEQLRQNKLLSNLLNGIYLPNCLPHFKITDYGQDLEESFLLAVANSYEDQFPKRKFHNYRKGELKMQVGIAEGNRHDQLIAKMAEGPAVGIQFFPLQGYSILADREQLSTLPKSAILSGVVDMATAMVAYPDVLARDYNTPCYDCAANFWQTTTYSLHFRAHDGKLAFGCETDLDSADGCYSGGLLLLG